jgi:hypothetical protein
MAHKGFKFIGMKPSAEFQNSSSPNPSPSSPYICIAYAYSKYAQMLNIKKIHTFKLQPKVLLPLMFSYGLLNFAIAIETTSRPGLSLPENSAALLPTL